MMTNVLETVIEETKPFSIRLRRRSMYSRFISITSLWEISISPLSRRLTAYLQRPCCLQVLYHVPAKRSIPFAGLFIACSSWQSSLFQEDRRSGIRAGDIARAGCPRWARGFRSVPSSFPQSDLSHEGTESPGAHIRLSACAGLPAPYYYHKPPAGGFRLSCASRSRGIRAFPQGSPRVLYQYQLIYYCRYCRIFDTAFRYF